MIKIQEPNYQLMLNDAVFVLQETYKEYKKAVIKNMQFTWIDNDGALCYHSGLEERNKHIADLAKEITRLKFKVEEYKQKCGEEQNERTRED